MTCILEINGYTTNWEGQKYRYIETIKCSTYFDIMDNIIENLGLNKNTWFERIVVISEEHKIFYQRYITKFRLW